MTKKGNENIIPFMAKAIVKVKQRKNTGIYRKIWRFQGKRKNRRAHPVLLAGAEEKKLETVNLCKLNEDIAEEKKLPSIETIREIEQIVYVNETPEQAGMLIAINSGIRIGELCALQWKDVDLKRGTVHVNKTMQRVRTYAESDSETEICVMNPKSGSSIREIPLPGRLIQFLAHKCGRPEEYIVPGKKVAYCEPRTLQYRFERFLKQHGFKEFHFHALRHCFASRCVELGFDAKSLCEIMGHSDIRITLQLYVHTSLRQKRALMERLDEKDALDRQKNGTEPFPWAIQR